LKIDVLFYLKRCYKYGDLLKKTEARIGRGVRHGAFALVETAPESLEAGWVSLAKMER